MTFVDLAHGKETGAASQSDQPITALAFSPTDRVLARADGQVIEIWDTTRGKSVASLTGHRGPVRALAFSPDGKLLASGSDDRIVKLWSLASNREIATLNKHNRAVECLAFSLDGKILASLSRHEAIELWDAAFGKHLASIMEEKRTDYTRVVFWPDGKRIAAAQASGPIKLFDVAESIKQAAGKGVFVMPVNSVATFPGSRGQIRSMAISPDGKTLVMGDAQSTIKILDIATRRITASLHQHTGEITALVFRPDGRMFASASIDGSVRLWSATAEP
jgi:WD40 repeat protein